MNTSIKKFIIPAMLCVSMYACTTNPYKASNKIYRQQAKALIKPLTELPPQYSPGTNRYQVGTINFNLRKPNFVIIHHTAQNACDQTVKTFLNTKTQVSAHYIICKDGSVHHMLNDYLRAWHAGVAKWGSVSDINSSSIGIEIDNNGRDDFTTEQINSLLILLSDLKKNYNIPVSNFIGHSDIAPLRKQDPSVKFPWKRLAETGFGNWPDAVLDTVPTGFNALHGLKMIGYDTKDSVAAVIAFKRHFIQTNVSPSLTAEDKAIILNLVNKF